MLRITRLTDYATIILSHMAKQPEVLYSAKVLAGELNIGAATVSKVLKIVLSHKLVCSTRGAEGGYRLADAPENISITRVIEAFEGPLAITQCALTEHDCLNAKGCHVQTQWQVVNGAIIKALSQVSLADMTRKNLNNTFIIRPEDIVKALESGVVS